MDVRPDEQTFERLAEFSCGSLCVLALAPTPPACLKCLRHKSLLACLASVFCKLVILD